MIKYLEKEEDFKELTKQKCLVDFYAEWCGPCRMLADILEDLQKESDITIIKVDTDKFPEMSLKMGIMSIPTLVVMEDSKEINKKIGYATLEELKDLIK